MLAETVASHDGEPAEGHERAGYLKALNKATSLYSLRLPITPSVLLRRVCGRPARVARGGVL